MLRAHPSRRAAIRPPMGTAACAPRARGSAGQSIVRELDDDDLVIAQGLENSAREDLALSSAPCLRYAGGGWASRAVIQQALTIDRAEASKLISVAKAVPRGSDPGDWQGDADRSRTLARIRRVAATRFHHRSGARCCIPSRGLPRRTPTNGLPRRLAPPRSGHGQAARCPAIEIKDAAGRAIAEIRTSDRDVRSDAG